MDRLRVQQVAAALGFQLLNETDSHDWRFDVPATSGKQYRVARRRSTQAWECDCPSWKFARKDGNGLKPNCKHLNDLMPVLALVLSSSSSSVAINSTTESDFAVIEDKPQKKSKKDSKLLDLGRRQIG